jgi:acyl-coenzyme A synthetase/AMP-(fatty) acid ligase
MVMDAARIGAGAAPLLQRPMDDILFWRPGRSVQRVTGAGFLRAAARVAAGLPEASAYLNLCRDPSGTAIALAASMLRGRPCVLVTDPSPGGIALLAARFPGAYPLLDEGAECPPGLDRGGIATIQPGDADGPTAGNPTFAPDMIALIGVTSGSSGKPSAHPKSWGALDARNHAAAQRFGLRDGGQQRPLVGAVSPTHMYGMETMVLLPLHAHLVTWCAPSFFPGDAAANLAEAASWRAGDSMPAQPVFITTPLQLGALVQTGVPLPAMHAVVSATAPLEPGLAARAEALWDAPVLEIFGATEIGSIASRRTAREEAWTLYDGVSLHRRDGRVEAVAEGAPPTPLSDVLDLLPGGGFRLVSRSSDIVKRGGRRASLAGLTRILAGLDGVLDAAFVMPEPSAGRSGTDRPLAFAVAPGRDGASLLAELRGLVEPAFLPRRIQLVERLPRNEIGKLPREALLALAAGR